MPVRKKSLSTDTIIAIAATVTSICALLITVYQTVLTREQQLNSVWPYVIINNVLEDGEKATLVVTNNGVGPAIIESVDIRYKGQSYKSMAEVVQAMSKQLGRGPYGISWGHTALEKGVVIPQGQGDTWITVTNKSDYAIFRKEIETVDATIHYKSIYDEHWRSNFHPKGEDIVVKE